MASSRGVAMDISRKTDYAVRMLSELVRSQNDIVSVRQAAENNQVPYSFARSIQHDLVKSGIVESVRGSHGGMRLAVDPRTTTLRYIVEAMQGPIYVQGCVPDEDVDSAECGNLTRIWCEAERLLRDYLDAVTLYQVVVEGRCPVLANGPGFVALTPQECAARDA